MVLTFSLGLGSSILCRFSSVCDSVFMRPSIWQFSFVFIFHFISLGHNSTFEVELHFEQYGGGSGGAVGFGQWNQHLVFGLLMRIVDLWKPFRGLKQAQSVTRLKKRLCIVVWRAISLITKSIITVSSWMREVFTAIMLMQSEVQVSWQFLPLCLISASRLFCLEKEVDFGLITVGYTLTSCFQG